MMWVMCCNLILHGGTPQGFFQLFAQGGGSKMRLYGLLGGGGQVHICEQSMWENRGVQGHAVPESFPVENCLVCMCFDSERSLKHDHK